MPETPFDNTVQHASEQEEVTMSTSFEEIHRTA
jgi:hypothetical protein